MGKVLAAFLIPLSVLFLAGCGGVHKDYYYRPTPPLQPSNNEPVGNGKSPYNWQAEQDGVKLTIYSVKLGTRLVFIIGPAIIIPSIWEKRVMEKGPLQLHIAIECSDGAHVSFDPEQFTVAINDGRKFLPVRGCENSPSELESLQLANRSAWVGCLE